MQTSEQVNELAAALAKAQAKMELASKSTKNDFFKSRYADLASVWEACRGPLSENGLSVVQAPSTDGTTVTVETLLLHASGQWIRCSLSCATKKDDAQGIGSVITYLRRYSLQSIVGVAPDDDDDGNAASNVSAPPKKEPKPKSKPELTDDDRALCLTFETRMNRCEDLEALRVIGSEIPELGLGQTSPALERLRRFYAARRALLETQGDASASSQQEEATA